MELSPEDANIELTAVQIAIEGINDRILLLQFERQRYEQMGHTLVDLMLQSTVPQPRDSSENGAPIVQ